MAAIAQGSQRRALIIAGVGFGLVLALFVGSRLLGGGSGGESAEPSLPPTSVPRTTPGTPPRAGEGGEGTAPVVAIPPVPDSFEALELRDPFTPPLAAIELLRELHPAPPEPGAPGQPSEPAPPGSIVLRGVAVVGGRDVATLEVDGEFFEAAEGERFGAGDQFMVVSLDAGAQCGTFLFGDESFERCAGQGGEPAPGAIPQK